MAEDSKPINSVATPKALLDEAFPDPDMADMPEKVAFKQAYKTDTDDDEPSQIKPVRSRKLRRQRKHDEKHDVKHDKHPKHDVMTIIFAVIGLIGLLIFMSIFSRLSNLENEMKILFLRNVSS